jgi:hypothetical protein
VGEDEGCCAKVLALSLKNLNAFELKSISWWTRDYNRIEFSKVPEHISIFEVGSQNKWAGQRGSA